MSIQSGAGLYSSNAGIHNQNVELPFVPVPARSPTAQDVGYPIGKRWVNTAANLEYTLTSETSIGGTLLASWSITTSVAGALNTITTQDTNVVTPVGGNIFLNGAGSQLTTTGAGSTATVGFVNAVVFPGSATATTTLTAASGDISATNGNLNLQSAGNKINIHATTPANDSVGSAVLVGGTVTVATTAVTASSLIFVSYSTFGGAQGIINAPAGSITPGVSFVINSSNPADTSTINYWIIN